MTGFETKTVSIVCWGCGREESYQIIARFQEAPIKVCRACSERVELTYTERRLIMISEDRAQTYRNLIELRRAKQEVARSAAASVDDEQDTNVY